MPSFWYNTPLAQLMQRQIDLREAGDDIRVMLVDATSTGGTQREAATISAITTLGELSGTNYSRKNLANQTVTQDDGNNRAAFDADNPVWTQLGADNAAIRSALLFKFVTDDTDSVPLAYIDNAPEFPLQPNGGDFTLNWNAAGILQLQA